MKKLGIVAITAFAFALTGCGAPATEPTPTPTQTETVSPNADACEDFAALTLTVPDEVNDSTDNANDMWEGVRVSFDEVALTAEGTVRDRMLDLVNDWPKLTDIVIYNNFDDYNAKLQAVERACAAEDIDITAGVLTTS